VQQQPPVDASGYGAGEQSPETAGGDDAWEGTRAGADGFGTPGAAGGTSTGHPAVDAVLGSLANAARLAPADQIAEYEAAHEVLRETLAGIDG
jgi:hypothetical protein